MDQSGDNKWISWPPNEKVIETVQSIEGNNGAVQGNRIVFNFNDVPTERAPSHPYQVAAHCVIYAKTRDSRRAVVIMQMRFDGKLGFPGGLVDPEDTSIVNGLNRELAEEMDFDTASHSVTADDFMMCGFTSVGQKIDNLRYFYAKEVTEDQIKAIEGRSLGAKDHGVECMGHIRVPIVDPFASEGLSALRNFLKNNFVGHLNNTCKTQLIWFLLRAQILSLEEMSSVSTLTSFYTAGGLKYEA